MVNGAVKVIILCGGQGTRLREETEYRPKPLVDVGGRPILWHIMKMYAHYGHQDFVLCLGYRGQMIKDYFLNYETMNNDFTLCLGKQPTLEYRAPMTLHGAYDEQNFNVTLAETGVDSMTGSRVKQVEKYVGDGTVMVTYGDGVSDVNIGKLMEFHKSHGKLATITTMRPFSRFGILELGAKGEVQAFKEKPQVDGWASAGFFVFEKEVFKYLSADPSCVLERDPLEKLAADGQLMAYRHEGFFFAMDTYREYLYLNDLWNKGEAPWAIWRKPNR